MAPKKIKTILAPPAPVPEPEEVIEEKKKPPQKVKFQRPAKVTFEAPEKLWWHKPKCQYAFSHPHIRERLEKLMGSNLVLITSRKYVKQLHDRVLEDYIQSMSKRVKGREENECDREKDLVLKGLVPISEAPIEMANHPVLLIHYYCEKLIAERRAKIKVQKVYIPLYLFEDDTPNPPYGLSISEGHVFRVKDKRMCIPPSTHLRWNDEQDIVRGYMMTKEDYELKQKYESDGVKDLDYAQDVMEMYEMADDVIGALRTIELKK